MGNERRLVIQLTAFSFLSPFFVFPTLLNYRTTQLLDCLTAQLLNYSTTPLPNHSTPQLPNETHDKTHHAKTEPGGILTVADDLLKNDGQKFLEMMEQLADKRIQREREAADSVNGSGGGNNGDDYDEDDEEDEEDDEDDEDDEELFFFLFLSVERGG